MTCVIFAWLLFFFLAQEYLDLSQSLPFESKQQSEYLVFIPEREKDPLPLGRISRALQSLGFPFGLRGPQKTNAQE